MDLRSLGGSTWKGFSDKELQGMKKDSSPVQSPVDDPSTSSGPVQCMPAIHTTTVSTVSESEPIPVEASHDKETESRDLVEEADKNSTLVKRNWLVYI